jgi:hypothetical protein
MRLETTETSISGETRSARFLDAESLVETATITETATIAETSTVAETATIRSSRPTVRRHPPRIPLLTTLLLRREFETLLESSWVYRRVRSNECDWLISSYTFRTEAWSILSELSLDDISIVSVFRLPMTLDGINRTGLGLTFSSLLSGKELPKPYLLCTTDKVALSQSGGGVGDVKQVLDVVFREGENRILVEALSAAGRSHNAELPTIK